MAGTLRQCLCIKENLNFNDTGCVDLGTKSFSLKPNQTSPGHLFFTWDLQNDIEHAATEGTVGKILCTKYKSDTANSTYVDDLSPDSICISASGYVGINTSVNMTAAELAQSLKGVLLAYKKASS